MAPALHHALLLIAQAGLSPGVWTEAKDLPPSLRRQFDLRFASGSLTMDHLLPVFVFKAAADAVAIVVLSLEMGLESVRGQCSRTRALGCW